MSSKSQMKRLVPVVVTVFVLGTLPGCGEGLLIGGGTMVLLSCARGQREGDLAGGLCLGAVVEGVLLMKVEDEDLGYWDLVFFIPTEEGRAKRERARAEKKEKLEPKRREREAFRLAEPERYARMERLGAINAGLVLSGGACLLVGMIEMGEGPWLAVGSVLCLTGFILMTDAYFKAGSQKAELFIAPNGFALTYRF